MPSLVKACSRNALDCGNSEHVARAPAKPRPPAIQQCNWHSCATGKLPVVRNSNVDMGVQQWSHPAVIVMALDIQTLSTQRQQQWQGCLCSMTLRNQSCSTTARMSVAGINHQIRNCNEALIDDMGWVSQVGTSSRCSCMAVSLGRLHPPIHLQQQRRHQITPYLQAARFKITGHAFHMHHSLRSSLPALLGLEQS